MSKYAVKFNNKEGSKEIVVVKTPDEVLKYIANQELEKITVEKINDPVMNFDLVKQALTYVQELELLDTVTGFLVFDQFNIFISDCNHDNGRGQVIQLKRHENDWEVKTVLSVFSENDSHFGKGLELLPNGKISIFSDLDMYIHCLNM